MNKRGSHVGVIASFGIFILFLLALYFVLEPAITTQKSKQSVLENLETELINKFSNELTVAIITADGNCSVIDDSSVDIAQEVECIVKDINGNEVDSNDFTNYIEIKPIDGKLWIYYANSSFDSTTFSSPGGCVSPSFESIRKSDEVFLDKIYYAVNNLEDFKNEINMQAVEGFSFSFLLDNGTTINAGEKNVSSEVFGSETRIQYYDEKAISRFGTLGVKVW